jgi:methyl-accepting chemotaxis protein
MSGDDDADPGSGESRSALAGILATITPNFVRKRFALKFGLVLLLMATVIGLIGLTATATISSETQENVESEYRGVADQQANTIDEWVQRNRLSTKLLSESVLWNEDSTSRLERALTTKKSGLATDVFEIHIVDRSETGLELTATTSSGLDAVRSWFNDPDVRPDLDDLSVADVHMTDTYRVGSDFVVGFVSPVNGVDGRWLLVEVSTEDIRAALQGSARAEGGFAQVVDGETDTVMIDETGDDTLRAYASGDALDAVRLGTQLRDDPDATADILPEMPANADVIDETYTVGVAPVPDTTWTVLVHAPRSSVFGFVQTVSQYGLLATIGMILLIGGFGAVLGYSTSASIDRLTRKTEEMRSGNLDVDIVTSRIDNIGRLYDGFADMRDSLSEQITEAERARKEAEVSRAEAMEMSTYLQEKAEEYSGIMQQCAAGDLTQRMEQDGENDSMDRIASEFNEMIGELEKTTGQLKSYVDEVEEAGAEVEASSKAVRDTSEQIAESIQTISDDAYTGRERLQRISTTMDEVATTLEGFADQHPDLEVEESLDQIRTVAADLEEAADLSESTMAESENVAGAAEEQAAELNEVSERAQDLQRYASPLRDILDRFETEAEHEFVFTTGPTGSGTGSTSEEAEDDD